MPHLIIVTWSNHLAANAGDGSAGKRAVSNTAKTFRTLCIYNIQRIFISLTRNTTNGLSVTLQCDTAHCTFIIHV